MLCCETQRLSAGPNTTTPDSQRWKCVRTAVLPRNRAARSVRTTSNVLRNIWMQDQPLAGPGGVKLDGLWLVEKMILLRLKTEAFTAVCDKSVILSRMQRTQTGPDAVDYLLLRQ